MSEPNTPSWLSWVAPVLGVMTTAGWVLRNLFISAVKNVTRDMHIENQERLSDLESTQREQGETLAWIKGRMVERWGGGEE